MKWPRRSDSTEAAAHKRMAEGLGDFSVLSFTPLEIFLAIAVAAVAIALLAIWGPDAIAGVIDAFGEVSP